MLFLSTGTDLYLLLEECVCVSPEDVQHGYIWAGSRTSIDGWVTVSRGLCRRTQAVKQHRRLHTYTNTSRVLEELPSLLAIYFKDAV